MMTEREILLCLIGNCSELLGNRSCNDVPERWFEEWTKQSRQELAKGYHKWNGDIDEYDEQDYNLCDFALLDYLSYKLLKETGTCATCGHAVATETERHKCENLHMYMEPGFYCKDWCKK